MKEAKINILKKKKCARVVLSTINDIADMEQQWAHNEMIKDSA